MISIVVCSINIQYFEGLKKNIQNTIGSIEYEIIRIDNLKNNWAITKAYNYGYEKAIYNNLLFIHEDIFFKNNNWGQVLVDELKNKEVGLIGVAGANYKSRFPSAFWHLPKDNLKMNVIQHFKNKEKEFVKYGFSNSNDVKVVDGVFLGLKKDLTIKFNDKIKGFHCYDLGVSLDILNKGYRVFVTDKILIEHYSIGTTDKKFLENYILFHKLYAKKIKKNITKIKNLDKHANQKFVQLCIENRFFSINLLIKSLKLNLLSQINFNYLKMGVVKLLKNN
ncbi:MAG: glycosyltransferase [Polaribacter sp.]|uniref:glycosyltransferase n=1 Tax=Polaribacter sp. TaxID=1920175 RepID=UPI0032662B17